MAGVARRGLNPALLFLVRRQQTPRVATTTTTTTTTSTSTTRWGPAVSRWNAIPPASSTENRRWFAGRVRDPFHKATINTTTTNTATAVAPLPAEYRRCLASVVVSVSDSRTTEPARSMRMRPARTRTRTKHEHEHKQKKTKTIPSVVPFQPRNRNRRRRWDDWYDLLVRYQRDVGHPNVPQHCSVPERVGNDRDGNGDGDGDTNDSDGDNDHHVDSSSTTTTTKTKTTTTTTAVPLGKWLDKQRQLHANGTLEATRFQKLDGLGVAWDVRSWNWDGMVRKLVSYSDKHGNAHVPQNARWEGTNLGAWLKDVRQRKLEGSLDRSRREQLEGLGVVWDMHSWRWNRMFLLLVGYKERRGNTSVKQTHKESGENLGRWCSRQKEAYRNGTLNPGRIQKLEEIGFSWVSAATNNKKKPKTKPITSRKAKGKATAKAKPATKKTTNHG